MPSSRATIAAGTRPPRVMQTIASNGPTPVNRQASARESRWNWSQETGKILAGSRGGAGFAASSASTVLIEGWLIGGPCIGDVCKSAIPAQDHAPLTSPISDRNHRWQSGNLVDRGLVGDPAQGRLLHHRLQPG